MKEEPLVDIVAGCECKDMNDGGDLYSGEAS